MLRTLATPTPELFAGWPDWLVMAVAIVVVALAIWVLGKLLKWALWLLIGAVLVVGALAVVGLLLKA